MYASTARARRAWTWFQSAATASVLLVGAACQYEPPTQPDLGYLKVDVVTTGEDTDLDGYAFTVDGERTITIGASTNTGSFFVPSGPHTVSIGNVAPNCSVSGATTRQADVTPRQTTVVLFTIACAGTGVRITTATSGPDNPANYKATVNQQPSVSVAANGTHTIGRLAPGTHTVTLTVPEHCTVAGDNPLSVAVSAKAYAAAGFTVVCSPVARREKIAYVVGKGVVSSIETITLDGSRVDQLDARGYSVAWKRDGRQLVVSDAECGWDYYYYDLGICRGGVYLTDPELGTVTRPAAAEQGFNPAWSPARDELVFDRQIPSTGSVSAASQLFVLAVGTPAAQALSVAGSRLMLDATWSPDGERIAYVCAPEPSNLDLCVVNRDGSGYRRLTDDGAQMDPAWSPDGKTIAFRSIAAGGASTGEIALLDIASGKVTVLGPGFEPAWSPDGSRLVFAVEDGLFLMNADGSNRRRLTTGRHLSPAWRPIR